MFGCSELVDTSLSQVTTLFTTIQKGAVNKAPEQGQTEAILGKLAEAIVGKLAEAIVGKLGLM